jgi:hypothetical protein
MEYSDYLRNQAAKYRELTAKNDGSLPKRNSWNWPTSAKKSPMIWMISV